MSDIKNLTNKEHLAIAYQYLALREMDDLTYTHLSCRAEDGKSFYIYPFGMLFEEVTPQSLLRVDFTGNVLEGKEEQYNQTGYIIHGNIYQAREDVNAIFHLHTYASIAVSVQKAGLLPVSQFALHFYGKLSYHGYNSLALEHGKHGNDIIKDLGQNNTMLMRNHGMLTCGRTIWEANFYAHHLEQACKVQTHITNLENIIYPSEEVCKQTVHDLLSFEKDLGWRDWQAIMRKLDRLKK